MTPDPLTEEIAAQLHRTWSAWVVHMLDNLTYPNIQRWRLLAATPYQVLPDEARRTDLVLVGPYRAIVDEAVGRAFRTADPELIAMIRDDLQVVRNR